MGPRKRRRWFRWAALALFVVLAISCGKSAFLVVDTWVHDRPAAEDLPPGYVDDASRMNHSHVAEVWDVPADPAQFEGQLRQLLDRARRDRIPVAVSGARHSMGGHTIYPDGIVLNMLPWRHMELDAARRILHVGAGARWSDVVPYLDAHGLSVAIMQSNNDFSVGGSVSVNCHGWQQDRPPIASSVESFRLMKADRTVVHCSRQDNAQLFGLVLGGYGLFGVILDVDLRVVPNERYRPEVEIIPAVRRALGHAGQSFASLETSSRVKSGRLGKVQARWPILPGWAKSPSVSVVPWL